MLKILNKNIIKKNVFFRFEKMNFNINSFWKFLIKIVPPYEQIFLLAK